MSFVLKSTASGTYTSIPRAAIDETLDAGKLFVRMTNGTYQQARRNGKSKTWKTDSARIYIPFKHGFKGCGQITNALLLDDCLHPDYFRHVDDLTEMRR